MIRHYCVTCRRKLNEDKMIKLQQPYERARMIWVCLVDYAKYINHTTEVKS